MKKRNLVGKMSCYYENHGCGSYIAYNNYPDRVKIEIDDEQMEHKFVNDTMNAKGNFGVWDSCGVEITNEGGFLTWLKKWMKNNHVYFERTDYEKVTSTSTRLRYSEYDYK